ncbi:hypothetical protein F2P81_021100 [Scophthalmus maximus]|uniref:Peptidase M14 domain-containing protein n=1 Tax=Scophthalmus maximus TaxID=52904 RepID=A0A6A4RWC8_SCOMX|nr:hypothetical protein F2P81_021100 [Scophthalmus maximus]
MEDVERGNPELVSSAVYGHTVEGRNITLLKLGLDNSEGREKKLMWVDCGIHAREWIAPAFCQWFVKEIVHTYKTNEKLEQMLQNLDVYVTPVINVDGYTFTWANDSTRLWRKSRSLPLQGSNCYGVDLNRNFNANWGTVGVSFDSCANTYCGKSPGSEPEARAVMDFIDPNSGSSRDWARLMGVPFSYTFELRDTGEFSHLLPEEQIQPACEEAYAGALSIITHVHDKTFSSAAVAAVTGVASASGVAVAILSTVVSALVTAGVSACD